MLHCGSQQREESAVTFVVATTGFALAMIAQHPKFRMKPVGWGMMLGGLALIISQF
jgi:hypothetical protein